MAYLLQSETSLTNHLRGNIRDLDYTSLGQDITAALYRGVGNPEVRQMTQQYFPDMCKCLMLIFASLNTRCSLLHCSILWPHNHLWIPGRFQSYLQVQRNRACGRFSNCCFGCHSTSQEPCKMRHYSGKQCGICCCSDIDSTRDWSLEQKAALGRH